jgi:hypothetical protein
MFSAYLSDSPPNNGDTKVNRITIGGSDLWVDPVQCKNLATLRDWLLTNDVAFDMSYFRSTFGEAIALDESLSKTALDAGPNECGTAGCAVGWAPFVIPPIDDEYYRDGNLLNYAKYGPRIFGDAYEDAGAFSFLFGGRWANVDNTRHGAAYRIDLFLGLKDNADWPFNSFAAYRFPSTKKRYIAARNKWLAERGIIL